MSEGRRHLVPSGASYFANRHFLPACFLKQGLAVYSGTSLQIKDPQDSCLCLQSSWATVCAIILHAAALHLGATHMSHTHRDMSFQSCSYLKCHYHKLHRVPLLLRRKVQRSRHFGEHHQVLCQGTGKCGQRLV